MKIRTITLLALLFAKVTIAQISFNTGSTELDADLNSINSSAKLDLAGFKVELAATYDISTKELDGMFSIGMQAGEVYLALEIGEIADKPVSSVVSCYKSNKSKGWGYIAKEMGIKPGSAEFHELKGKTKTRKDKGNSGKNGHSNGNGNGNGNSNKGGKK
ncbi:MAG: hypothetical protein H6582_02640 [Crocinitomicaceae bacterium]|nr:hypothetical protein [Crocinitomicaceae bacterium]